MTYSDFIAEYDSFCRLLIEARNDAGVSQATLAKCLGHPQSYVSKYERNERRLDIVEFMCIARCLRFDPRILLDKLWSTRHGASPN